MPHAPAAHAESADKLVTVRVGSTAALPFEPDELREAILLRVDRAHVTVPAVVSVERLDSRGSFRIVVGGRRRDVTLDAATGPYAVRNMALLAVDMVEGEASAVPQVEVRPPPFPRWTAAVQGLGAPGGAWGDGRFEGKLEGTYRLIARWRATVGAGYGRVTRTVASQSVVVDSVPVQAGLGLDLGWMDLRAAAAVRLFRAGETRGAVYGGWLEIRPSLVRMAKGRLALVLAVELATERLQVRPPKSDPVFSSGYVTPWLGLALSSP